jgi:chromosome partitioning protein
MKDTPKRPRITVGDLVATADRAANFMSAARNTMLKPEVIKTPPNLTSQQLADLVGLNKDQFNYRLNKGGLPEGTRGPGGRRHFSLNEGREWAKEYRKDFLRPEGGRAVCCAVANFKGGVAKTTTTMTLAQGFALKGHKVLMIDCDPQASLTLLCGWLPNIDVGEDDSLVPALLEQGSIKEAIRATYWPGIDLVAGCSGLFGAEMYLPAKQRKDSKYEFWNVLNLIIEEVRDDYDIILLDTAPALSYLTINAMIAADGLIVPLPPTNLDFASASQFWYLFSDFMEKLIASGSLQKSYDFIHVLMTKVDTSAVSTNVVSSWINAMYGQMVLPVEIPETIVAKNSAVYFGTVYDVPQRKVREAYERVNDVIEQSIRISWSEQLSMGV